MNYNKMGQAMKDDTTQNNPKTVWSCQDFNFTTWFILPLLQIRPTWFGFNGGMHYLHNTYLNENKKQLIIRTIPSAYALLPLYNNEKNNHIYTNLYGNASKSVGRSVLEDTRETLVYYDIPERFLKDVEMYCERKVSKFSDEAKHLVCKFSDLQCEYTFEHQQKGLPESGENHPLIWVMLKGKAYKSICEDFLLARIEEDAELPIFLNKKGEGRIIDFPPLRHELIL